MIRLIKAIAAILLVGLLLATDSGTAIAWQQPSDTGSPQIYAPDGTYLGNLNANRFDPNSVSNPFGPYGNPFSPNSINNPFSSYGNPFSPNSATNPFGQGQPPMRRDR